jgi:hypothetical protein
LDLGCFEGLEFRIGLLWLASFAEPTELLSLVVTNEDWELPGIWCVVEAGTNAVGISLIFFMATKESTEELAALLDRDPPITGGGGGIVTCTLFVS